MDREKNSLKQRGTSTIERRQVAQNLTQEILAERKRLLALLVGLSVHKNNDHAHKKLLNSFSQLLMDYIALGHFGLYERVIAGRERRKRAAECALQLYASFSHVTQLATQFNSKYGSGNIKNTDKSYPLSLSRLGESLASRFEIEDKILGYLLK